MHKPPIAVILALVALVPTWFARDALESAVRARLAPRDHVEVRHYRMKAQVRLLLFWVGSDDVGGGRVVRRQRVGGTTYELLIGSDPDRAPRRINRWGYIREEVDPSGAVVVGLKAETDDESMNTEPDAGRDVRPFGVLRGTVSAEESYARTGTIPVGADVTYHDVADVLAMLDGFDGWRERRIARRPEDRPGFLTAVDELVRRSADAHRARPGIELASDAQHVPYTYRAQRYDLRLHDERFRTSAAYGGQTYAAVVEGKFRTTNRQTGRQTSFELVYGTVGDLAGVPIQITYQPTWWFKAELVLDESLAETFPAETPNPPQ